MQDRSDEDREPEGRSDTGHEGAVPEPGPSDHLEGGEVRDEDGLRLLNASTRGFRERVLHLLHRLGDGIG